MAEGSSAQLTSNVFDTALIFEGGGMRASYTCAFARVLLEQGIYFDNVYGLSAGSSNAVNYVSRDLDRTRRSFVDIVGFPGFGGVGSFLRGTGIFHAENIYEKYGLPGHELPFDMETTLANPAKLTIESFERDTGKTVYWTKADMPDVQALMVRVRASSTLPFVMPSPCINGRYYYDGGLGEGAGFLLPRAQADGFKKFVIVRTRPKAYRKPESSGKLLDRAIDLHFANRPYVRKALDTRAERYNVMCDEIEALEAAGRAYVFYAKRQTCESGETNMQKLAANYETGYAQAMEELPALKEFLGL